MSAESPIKVVAAVGFSPRASTCDPDGAAMAFIRRLQDQDIKLEIVAVAVGGSCAEEAALAALARGADRAILVNTDRAEDPQAASLLLAGVIRRENPGLVLTGAHAVEDSSRQIGPRVAANLRWSHASGVRELDITQDRKSCRIVRDMDGIRERLQFTLPAVIDVHVADSDIPLLSLYEIVGARSKPVDRVKGRGLASVPKAGFTVLRSERAAPIRKGRTVESVEELIKALHEEAHVI